MPSKKELFKRIEHLENHIERLETDFATRFRELGHELSHDLEVRHQNTHMEETRTTIRGDVNAIIDHLGLEITAKSPEVIPPSIKVNKTVKPRKRTAAKKGVKNEESSQAA